MQVRETWMNQCSAIDALLGVAVGDALGVPVEFLSREALERDPVKDMRGYGTHHQPPGTWSDDSSLTFCLAEMICNGYDLNDLARRFINWREYGYWSAHGRVFDIGIGTSSAITALLNGVDPALAGGNSELNNGNGSLMRILPLAFYIKDRDIEERFNLTRQVSSLTHSHVRSVIACFLYLEMARQLLGGNDTRTAYQCICRETRDWLIARDGAVGDEVDKYFLRILSGRIGHYSSGDIQSSGYVVHTLEAAIWCLLTTNNYCDAVLKSVNMGEDTDTTAAVAGGLAGLIYGREDIPMAWLKALARKSDIEDLGKRLSNKTGM